MSIGLVITIVLAALTVAGKFDLSLFQILLPALIELGIELVLLLLIGPKIFRLFKGFFADFRR